MTSTTLHILLVMLSDLSREPRVYRQIKVLSSICKITTAGYAPSSEPVSNHWHIETSSKQVSLVDVKPSDFSYLPLFLAKVARRSKVYLNRGRLQLRKIRSKAATLQFRVDKFCKAFFLKFSKFDYYYWSQPIVCSLLEQWRLAGEPKFDLIIVHDQELLPAVLKIANKQPVLLDAHEYYPSQMASLKFNLFLKEYRNWICSQYMPQVAGMITVSESIAREYEDVYGVKSKVVFNAPFYQDLDPHPVNPQKIKLVHHGIPSPERGLEVLIDMFHTLDNRFILDFFLMRNQSLEYLKYLENLASQFKGRIRFLEPVPMEDLPRVLNTYDIGLCMIQPWNFNYANCLPNKFFEFVQARLAVAIGPTPDMKKYCNQYQFGIISPDFEAKTLANKIKLLDDLSIMELKQKAHLAARYLSAETSYETLIQEVSRILV